ncbi:UNVERIFIED_CONTAM: hypothetical protein ABIC26_001489 [Paenibacillus sp. PvR008]
MTNPISVTSNVPNIIINVSASLTSTGVTSFAGDEPTAHLSQ